MSFGTVCRIAEGISILGFVACIVGFTWSPSVWLVILSYAFGVLRGTAHQARKEWESMGHSNQ